MKAKSKVLLITVLALMLLGIISFKFVSLNGTFNIEIKNNTSKSIRDLKITYNKIQKDILIPALPPKGTHEIQITPHENFGENAMWITYKDKKGENHKEVIFGYFEKGYGGNAVIDIVSVQQNGILKFKIKSEIK